MKKSLLPKNKLILAAIIIAMPVLLNCTCKHCEKKVVPTTTINNRINPEPGVVNQQELDSLKAIQMQKKLKSLQNKN
ncbi:MAG: hypothetical protein RJA07_819 [Bacteroidota bacterium]|jgi:hypothetical protein